MRVYFDAEGAPAGSTPSPELPPAGEAKVPPVAGGDKTPAPEKTSAEKTPAEKIAEGSVSRDPNKTEAEKKDGEGEKKDGPPEDGKYAFTAPEGFEIDETKATEFSTLASDLKLSQEGAQKLVDYHSKALKAAKDENNTGWQAIEDGWVKEAKADPEFGGVEFDANLAIAGRAVKAFGDDAFTQALVTTRVGNHPAFIRFMWKLGKEIGEDGAYNGGSPKGGGSQRDADVLFGDVKLSKGD